MLIGLLPLIGWAADYGPASLAKTSTPYNGDQTVQPLVRNGNLISITLGDEVIFGYDETGAPIEGYVRNAGVYDVTVEQWSDGEPVHFTYTVTRKTMNVLLANTEKVYGDAFPEPEWVYINEFPVGDEDLAVKGGKILFATGVLDGEGDKAIWCTTSDVYVANPDLTPNPNYNKPNAGGTATCSVAPAKIYAHALDGAKVFGECDEDADLQYEYLGWVIPEGGAEYDKYDDKVIAGKGTEVVVRAEGQEGENVEDSPYGLTVDASKVKIQDYEIVYEPFEFEGEMLPEQGKLTIEKKSITEEMVASVKYFVDGVEANYTVKEDGTVEVEGFTYGKVLTWEITMIDNDVCISDNGKRELTPDDVDTPVCVDGECGDDLEICGKGNYKDCIPFRVPDPQPTCLNITAGAEPGEFTLGEEFEINYEITGWQKGEDFSEAVEDVISYEIFDAAGEKVEQPIENAGEYTVKFTVGELPAEPAGLANYTVCDEPEDITVTVDPICIEQARIELTDQPKDDNDEPTCYAYTGGKIEPAIEVYFGETKLVEGTDYEVTYGNEEKDNIHVANGGIIIVKGLGNYANEECELTQEFCIAPGNAIVRVAPIDFNKSVTVDGATYYQNGRYYGQAEGDIVLEYEGITPEAFAALEITAARWGGRNVGFYPVAFFDKEGNQLTPGTMDMFDKPTNTLTECTLTPKGSDITVTLVPGLYEIRKNWDCLSFTGEITTTYGDRELINPATADIEELFKEFKDKFTGNGFLENDAMTWIDSETGLPRKEVIDISNAKIQLCAWDEENQTAGEPIVAPCNENGDKRYLPAGTFAVKVTDCASSNYYLCDIVLKVINQRRKISIWIDPMVLGPRDTFNEEAVTWAYQRNNEATDRGIALLDTDEDPSYDASVLRVPGNDDAKKFFNIKFRYSNKVELITLYVYNVSPFNPNYEPIVRRSDLGDTAGHFIIHRVAKDLQDNPWNDLVQKITAFDAETGSAWDEETPVEERLVEKVYFRTFDASQSVSSNLFDLFEEGEDGEWEPKTAEIGGELDTENGFPMYADKWYAMVLPFDCSVYELGHEFFQYGVINVLDESNTKDNVIAFKLQATGMIPANTPFCVKLGDMGQVVPEDGKLIVKNLDQMFFENKKIVAPRNKETGEIDFGCVYSEDESGVRFYGSYDGKFGFKANEYFFTTSSKVSTFNNYYYGSEDNTTWLRPSGSFLYTPEASGARTIIMQEEDGSFTAIESIENIAKVNTAEGWFTTNGVKLNAQPTQKGVYIHNGKKIVVK